MYKTKNISKGISLGVGLLFLTGNLFATHALALEGRGKANAEIEVNKDEVKAKLEAGVEGREKGMEKAGENANKGNSSNSKGKAQEKNPVLNIKSTLTAPEKLRAELRVENTTQLKANTLQEVDKRLATLNGLIKRIEAVVKLTDTEKAALTSKIQTEIATLTSLKAKAEANTDATITKTEAQAVVDSGKAYALLVAKTHVTGAADVELALVTKLTTLAETLQAGINKAKLEGKDVANLEKLLADLKVKLAEVKTGAEKAITLANTVTANEMRKSRETLKEAREVLRNARHTLNDAKKDAKEIVKGLQTLNASAEVSVSITPTIIATVTPTVTVTVTPTVEVTVTPTVEAGI